MSVFVFGSNLRGIHGKGSALEARRKYGAILGVGEGPMGGEPPTCYALPTKRTPYERMTLDEVRGSVDRFVEYARSRPDLTFTVVRVGCANAGFTDEQIAPLFREAPDNCELPMGWRTLASIEEGSGSDP